MHRFVNDLSRDTTTMLIGRRSYELMDYWDTLALDAADTDPVEADYARVWRATDKIVYLTTLEAVHHPRTRLERRFDPRAVAELVASVRGDVSIGGATLAGEALRAGLIDEVWTILMPSVVGGGLAAFPGGYRANLELVDSKRFDAGAVGLHYRVG